MIPFNYHHLYYFYIIAQTGSISAATKELRLAQPTLSAQLKQFEQFLGVKLFIRENRKLLLTEEGHKVLSYAKTIFDVGQELRSRIVDLSQKGRPHLNIGISHFVPKTIVDMLLNFTLKHEPEVYLHVKENTMDGLIEDLEDHFLDIILTDTPFETKLDGDIHHHFVGKIPIVFCANQNLAKKVKKFPEDLDGLPLILPTSPRQISADIKEFLYEHNIQPKIVGEIQDIEAIRRLALKGYGIAALNLLTIKAAPSKLNLKILNSKETQTIFEKVYVITKKRKHTPNLVEQICNNFRVEIVK